MFDNSIGDRYGRVLYKMNARMVVCCVLVTGVMLPWKSYADAEEFATAHPGEIADVNVHADEQPLVVGSVDTSAVVDANDKESAAIDTDPDLSDVVQLETGNGDQHFDLAGSRDIQSLDVVDTGSSVKLPRASDDIGGGIDHEKVKVDLGAQPTPVSNAMIGEGDRSEAELNELIEQADQPIVAAASINLPVTSTTVDAHSQANDAGNQLEEASNDAVGEEGAGLPYAVVLALLALIGLVPVARRSDQYHV